MNLQRKFAVWAVGILAALGYFIQHGTGYLFEHHGIVLASPEFAASVQPFNFILVILTVNLWFMPYTLWKQIVLAGFFLLAAATAIFSLNSEISISLPALTLALYGLATMFTLPKLMLWQKVFIGLIVGVLLGFDLKVFGVQEFSEYLKVLGAVFIDLIMMIVIPLIFFSLVSGINNMTDNALGRVGVKALLIYVLSAMFAIALGLIVALIFSPGEGIDLSALTPSENKPAFELPKLMQVLLHFIPHNALGAMAGATGKPETVQTVFFAIFVGVTLNLMGEQGKRIVEFSHSAAQLMFKMIGHIIKLAPLAVFGLMAWVTANLGVDAILQLLGLVMTTIVAMGIHLFILAGLILVLGRLNPIPFFKKSIEYQALAFSTSSSKATLATAMKIGEEKMGLSKSSASFVLPLGAAINMDGTAIYLGICAIFFSQAFNVPLDFHHYILIIFTATIASIGAAGYPGGSIVMMPMLLGVIGIPPEAITAGIGILIGVDRILDMFRTTINVTSDVALTVVIDRTEGTLNETLYNMSLEEIEEAQRLREY